MKTLVKSVYGTVSQLEPAMGKDQVKNNAGGFVFAIDDFKRLERFLILGVEGNTFYQSGKGLMKENAKCVEACIATDAKRTVDMAVSISQEGRAIKNDAALFVLAVVAGSKKAEDRLYALSNLSKVARTATHLFMFVSFVRFFRGWGRSLRNAISDWYNDKSADGAAFQALKYRSREGWSHKDLLRVAHVYPSTFEHNALFSWVVGKGEPPDLPTVHTYMELQTIKDEDKIATLLRETKAPWEFLPTELTTSKKILKALIPGMPLNALVRQLGKLTTHGALEEMCEETNIVCDNLRNKEYIRKSRLHPVAILIALKVYAKGSGLKGKLVWDPIQKIVDALNDAFYLAFQNVEPTGKKIRLAVDVSGSMGFSYVDAAKTLSCAEAAAAMTLITVATEPNTEVYAFSHTFKKLKISPKMRLDDVLKITRDNNFGMTDCALPMLDASKYNTDRDLFVIYTDNETWYGNVHPYKALEAYRKKVNAKAKLAVVACTPTRFSIADPADLGSMDFVGFDTNTPAAISAFAAE